MPNSNLEGLYVPPQNYSYDNADIPNGCDDDQDDLETGFGPSALEEITDVRINRLTNRFVGANRLESTYGRIRLRENAPLLRWASGLLLLCFSLDCISLLLRRSTLHAALIIVLCSMTCFQLGLFLFRNRLYSHLLIHYYQYVTTALGASAFSYVVFSDTVVACVFYGSTEPSCVTPGERTWRIEDSTRVAYGMSLLFGIMPFGFRVNFLNCLIMYTCALIVHLLLRTLSFLDAGFEYSRGSVFDAVLLDFLFLITIMATLLYGAYMYERNDRLVFIRMRRSQLESDQLQNELQMVREELGWAEDEANTNELKLEIERAKSDLDRMYPGAQIELQSWVLPFDALIIDKRVGEGSCGEVFRGRVRSQNACGGDLSSETFSTRLLRRTPSCSLLSLQSFATSHPSQALVSPQNQNSAANGGEPWGGDVCASSTIGPSRGLPAHRRDYSVMPSTQVVAIKRIPKHKITRKTVLSLLQETLAMSKCKHPNVLRLVGLVYDPFVCVVFEYMALGSLKDLLDASHPSALRPSLPQRTTSKLAPSDMSGKFPAMQSMRDRDNDIFRDAERKLQRESAIQALQEYTLPGKCVWTHTKTRMCVNVAAGVSYMHSKDIIHRDLKSSNLMVDATHAVKVADLGTARQLSHPYGLQQEPGNQNARTGRSARPMSRVGSPLWIAPEVISSEGEYDHKCDVWSFGVILCELMTHRDPYTDAEGRSKFNLLNVVEGTLSPLDFVDDVLEYTPPAIVRLARDCCNFDPQRRCTMKEALFRLLQIVVEQETHKFEADAIAAAGPYLRYSQPSRINVAAPRLASTSMDVTHGENFAQEPLFASQDGVYGTQVLDHRRTSRDYSAHTLSSTDDVLVDTLNQRDLDDLAASSEEEVETEVTENEDEGDDEDEDEDEHKEISRKKDGYADQQGLNNPCDRVCKENAKASDGSAYLKERNEGENEDDDDDDGDDEEEDVVVLVPRDSIGSSKDEDSESDLDDGFVSHLDFGANLDNRRMEHDTSSKDADQISVAGPIRGSEGLLQDMNSNSAQTLSDARLRPESMSTFGDSSAAGASMRVDIAEGSLGSIEGGAVRRVDSTMRPTLRQTGQSRKHASNSRLTRTQQGESHGSRRGEARNRPQSMTAAPPGLPGSESASFGETSKAQTPFLLTQGRPLRPCMSTHNLGETLAQEKVQSLLSTYPSMGSMVSTNYTGSRGFNMLESTLSERLRASSRRSGARSERTRDRRKQSQSCRVKRHSTTDAVRGNNPSGSHGRLKQSTSMRNSFQCIVEF